MAFRTNYRFERAERARSQKAKKEEKLKRRQERGADVPTRMSRRIPTNPRGPTNKNAASRYIARSLGEAGEIIKRADNEFLSTGVLSLGGGGE